MLFQDCTASFISLANLSQALSNSTYHARDEITEPSSGSDTFPCSSPGFRYILKGAGKQEIVWQNSWAEENLPVHWIQGLMPFQCVVPPQSKDIFPFHPASAAQSHASEWPCAISCLSQPRKILTAGQRCKAAIKFLIVVFEQLETEQDCSSSRKRGSLSNPSCLGPNGRFPFLNGAQD